MVFQLDHNGFSSFKANPHQSFRRYESFFGSSPFASAQQQQHQTDAPVSLQQQQQHRDDGSDVLRAIQQIDPKQLQELRRELQILLLGGVALVEALIILALVMKR